MFLLQNYIVKCRTNENLRVHWNLFHILFFFLLNAYVLCIFCLYDFYYSDNKHLYFMLSIILLLFYILAITHFRRTLWSLSSISDFSYFWNIIIPFLIPSCISSLFWFYSFIHLTKYSAFPNVLSIAGGRSMNKTAGNLNLIVAFIQIDNEVNKQYTMNMNKHELHWRFEGSYFCSVCDTAVGL